MALRHIALTASRRLLASSGAAGGGGSRHRAGGSGFGFTTGSSGSGSSSWVQSARFWSWGGSKGDDDADKGKKEEDAGGGDASTVDETSSVDVTHAGVDEAAAAPPSDDLGGGSGAAGEWGVGEGAAASDSSSDGGFFSGADTGASKEPGMTTPSPWSVAMKESIMDAEASHQPDDRQEGEKTPEIASPEWNVPSEDGEEKREKEEEAPHSPFVAPPVERKKFIPRAMRTAASASASGTDGNSDSTLPKPPNSNLYIRNLPREFDAAKLAELFLPFGDVLTARYVADAGPVPTGLVRFADEKAAAAATAALQGKKMGTEDSEPSQVVGLEISVAMSKKEREAAREAKEKEREERQQAWEAKAKEREEKQKAFLELQERKKAEWQQEERKRAQAQVSTINVKIHVKNCPRGLTAAQMSAVFAPFGNVSRVTLFHPFGVFPSAVISLSKDDAQTAIVSLQGVQLEGCKAPMEISFAGKPRPTTKLTAKPDPEKVEFAMAAARIAALEVAKEDIRQAEERKERTSKLAVGAKVIQERVKAYVPRSKRDQPGQGQSGGGGGGGFKSERKAVAGGVGGAGAGAGAAGVGFYGLGRRQAFAPGGGEEGAGGGRGGRGGEGKHSGKGVSHGGGEGKYSDKGISRGGTGAGKGARAAAPSLSRDARDKLAAAAEKMRARGKVLNADDFHGNGGRLGGGGRGGDRQRERRSRSVGGSTGFGIGKTLDEKTQALIDANLAEAQAMVADEEEWEWDPGLFQTHMALQLDDNFNDAEMNSAPYLPGLSKPRKYVSEEELLMQNKEWLMKFSDIGSDKEFERIKKVTMARFESFKMLETRERLKRGESPIQSDFMAERQLLGDEVAGITQENPLHEFAKKALATLDGNSGWSYDKKIKALKVLMKNAERYQPGAEQATKQ